MKQSVFEREIAKRMPGDVIFVNETPYDLTPDEIVNVFAWIKNFQYHFEEHGLSKRPPVLFVPISLRAHLAFDLYTIKSDQPNEIGKHCVYLTSTDKQFHGSIKPKTTVKSILRAWNL